MKSKQELLDKIEELRMLVEEQQLELCIDEGLLPCPFCGESNSATIDEEDNIDLSENSYYSVVCNYRKGGCGSSSGYKETIEEAVELWNTRK